MPDSIGVNIMKFKSYYYYKADGKWRKHLHYFLDAENIDEAAKQMKNIIAERHNYYDGCKVSVDCANDPSIYVWVKEE